jgi:hypothetical protein
MTSAPHSTSSRRGRDVIPALADTLARLDAAEAYCSVVAGPPPDEEWVGVDALGPETDVLRGWFEPLVASGHPRDVAGSFLAGWLAEILLHTVATSLQSERRTWPLDPTRLWIHRDAGGWFDGLAVDAMPLRVLADDPAADQDGVEVHADVEALRRQLAVESVAVLGPLFATTRSLAPFGLRGMWGATADALASGAAFAAFREGRSTASAFAAAMALVDDMVAAGAPRLTRPTPLAVSCTHGTLTASRKGTCCLWYKMSPEPGEERYCLSCPLRDDASQLAGFATWLDTRTPGLASA